MGEPKVINLTALLYTWKSVSGIQKRVADADDRIITGCKTTFFRSNPGATHFQLSGIEG
jgi:hypothetical protein